MKKDRLWDMTPYELASLVRKLNPLEKFLYLYLVIEAARGFVPWFFGESPQTSPYELASLVLFIAYLVLLWFIIQFCIFISNHAANSSSLQEMEDIKDRLEKLEQKETA